MRIHHGFQLNHDSEVMVGSELVSAQIDVGRALRAGLHRSYAFNPFSSEASPLSGNSEASRSVARLSTARTA